MIASRLAALAAVTLLPLAGSAQAEAPVVAPLAAIATSATITDGAEGPIEVMPHMTPIAGGVATYYGRKFAGSRTSSGERFDPDGLTAAHRTLPLGTHVQVTNPATGASVIVTINDRGPFTNNRVIDLSDAAAQQVGILRAGSGRVELAVLDN